MSRRLIIALAIVFVAAFAVGAYAEVQNIKVSGDILMQAIDRDNFTLSKGVEGAGTGLLGLDSQEEYHVSGLTTQVRLRVDADLTDNVSATVRLLNERSWGLENELGWTVNDEGNNSEFDIDLAFVTLKEFLYSPLTLTIGRQEIKFGNGFIIGDANAGFATAAYYVPPDLSLRKAFDAIRATLNYDPLVIDIIYAKIDESDWSMNGMPWYGDIGLSENNDVDLYGINAAYNLGERNASLDVYYFARVDQRKDAWIPAGGGIFDTKEVDADTIHTIGGLVKADIIPGVLKGSVEFAHQFGRAAMYNGAALTEMGDRDAWAGQAMITALYKEQPFAGFVYSYFSGDKEVYNGEMRGWDPMFEDQVANAVVEALLPATNCHVYNLWAGAKPTEDITVSLVYGYYRLAEDIQRDPTILGLFGGDSDTRLLGVVPYSANGFYSMTESKDLGHAFDLTATYDYTEDVQFGLTFGIFFPGHAFRKDASNTDIPVPGLEDALGYGNHETARQLIGSMKVTF